ncbi:hypothetical protein MMC07_004987 [Pseudocyphellaria aurata]|nr:hypothetical protein [Pseudocyphellaria aurata]
MADEIKNVIIAGAGGNLGPSILEALDKDPYFTVSVLSRKESSSTFPSHIKVHQVDSSYPEDQVLEALKGQDAIVLLLPPTDISIHKSVIDTAIKAGVKRVIPSEFGSDTSNPAVIEQVPVFKGKQEVTDYLKSKEGTGLSWTGIITGGFFDWGLKSKFIGYDLEAHKAVIYDDGNNPVLATLLSTIGTAVGSTLKNPSLTANKFIFINDFRVSQNEILASLEKATGGEKWEIERRTTAEAKSSGFEKLSKGDFSGVQDLILASIYGGGDEFDYSLHNESANGPLGLDKPESLDVIVEKVVKGEKV